MRPIIIGGEKVTAQDVHGAIAKEVFIKMGKKIMVCHLTLQNGHEVIGMAGVVDPSLFDFEIGRNISRDKAQDQVWSHLGGLLQNQNALKS